MDKKKIIFISLSILILIGGLHFYSLYKKGEEGSEESYFIFVCPSGAEIRVNYEEEGDLAVVQLEGKVYRLKLAVSASGARYANEDESVVFWEHQGEAMVLFNDDPVYDGCKLQRLE
ncbi:MAG: hypothetical protein GX240_07245 [Candidatus Atribacteria bacterium]|nr:hypothetical protein [Candidatus Atribacteria bacterium]